MFSESFGHALHFAHELHRKQKRKASGVPYVAHLLAVTSLVIEDGGSEEEAIAALLHDSLEDQGYRYPGGSVQLAGDIEQRFGAEVRRLVEALTERRGNSGHGLADVRARWRAHKQTYIEQIAGADPCVGRISCADSLHNVRSMTSDFLRQGDRIWERFRTKSAEDQLWAYGTLARALVESGAGPLALELDRAVDELSRVVGIARP